jgi:hypothetical protein
VTNDVFVTWITSVSLARFARLDRGPEIPRQRAMHFDQYGGPPDAPRSEDAFDFTHQLPTDAAARWSVPRHLLSPA